MVDRSGTPYNDVSTILPQYQPLLGLHLMNGTGKQEACLKHVYYYGKIFKKMKQKTVD